MLLFILGIWIGLTILAWIIQSMQEHEWVVMNLLVMFFIPIFLIYKIFKHVLKKYKKE